ncbi:MAG: sugar phosphate nucleotidyltransferase [Candidatus Nitrospinota bacterium M3_3B_026]
MNAMILAAGLGTRLLPYTERLPKPLFPILDKRLIEIAIEAVLRTDVRRIVVNVHHLADQVESFLRSRDFGVEIIILREEKILGTAGGIKNAEKWLSGDDFLVINSDIIPEPDWGELIEAHRARGAMATLALRAVPAPERYSPVCLDAGGMVTKLGAATGPGHAGDMEPMMFTGVSVLSPTVFGRIPPGVADMARDVYVPMVREGAGLYGVKTSWRWADAGTAADYHRAVMEALRSGEVTPAVMWGDLHGVGIDQPVYIETGAAVAPGARLGPNVAVHKGARVGEGAALRDCVVLPGSAVGEGSVREGEVI